MIDDIGGDKAAVEKQALNNANNLPGKPGNKFGGWQKGQSGNPKGRPPKNRAWATIEDELLGARSVNIRITVPDGPPRMATKGGERRLTQKYKEIVILEADAGAESTLRHALKAKEIQLGLAGNMDALKDLQDRERGKPFQSVNIGGQEDNPLRTSAEVDETLLELFRQIAANEQEKTGNDHRA
jgi:hypothetical protein